MPGCVQLFSLRRRLRNRAFRVICDRDMEGIVAKQGERQVHAGSDNLGQDQERCLQPGSRAQGLFRPPEGVTGAYSPDV
jgi:hypothetical protein